MMRTHILGETVLAVEERGQGPAALLVHGFPFDHRMWADVLPALARRRRLLVPDLRGHGSSPWLGDDIHGMELLASDLAALLEKESPEGADLVALSMGGYVALALAELRPDLVRTLALIDSRSGADSAEGREGREAMAGGVVEHGRGWLAERMLPVLVAGGTGRTVRARLRTMIEGTPVETIVADLAGMRDRRDRGAVLASLGKPLLVVVGEEDVLTPPAAALEMAELGGGTLVTLPGAGHMTPMEAPGPCAAAIVDLWDGR